MTHEGGDAPEAGSSAISSALSWAWKGLTDEASLTVGYGVLKWELDVTRTSDGASGTLTQRDDSALFVSYGTKPSFFDGSRFGYRVMVNYHAFHMTRQVMQGDQFADVGTEIKGYVVYAVPTLYYQWGEHRETGTFVRVGIGAGVGGSRFSGTVRLSTGEIVYTTQKDLEPRLTTTNFLLARWNHVGISFSYAAPRVYGDGYDVRVFGTVAYISYTYQF
jgi:hypothetical protein